MKTYLRGFAAGVLALGLVSVSAQDAAALPFSIASQIVINQDGVSGTIDPVLNPDLSTTLLFSSGVGLAGDVLIVDITLNAGSASIGGVDIGVSPGGFFEPIGAGAFDDGGLLQAPSSVVHVPFDPLFFTGGVGSFTFLPDQIDAGETTVRLFVTYTPGVMNIGDGVNFMISSGANFTVNGIVAIPEPSTIVLLGGGLLILGVTARRLRRSN